MTEPADASPAPGRAGLSAGARWPSPCWPSRCSWRRSSCSGPAARTTTRRRARAPRRRRSRPHRRRAARRRPAPTATRPPTPLAAAGRPGRPPPRRQPRSAGCGHLAFRKGDRIRFAVVSDAPGEVHLHGYDVERALTPGRRAALRPARRRSRAASRSSCTGPTRRSPGSTSRREAAARRSSRRPRSRPRCCPAGTAQAHGIVGREDLPIPSWLFAWGAAVVLVVSFVALAVLWPRPRLQHAPRAASSCGVPRRSRSWPARSASRSSSSSSTPGFAGMQTATANLAADARLRRSSGSACPFARALVRRRLRGDQPVARGRAAAPAGSRARCGRRPPEPLPYPARLGRWPAARRARRLRLARAGLHEPRRPEHRSRCWRCAYAAVQLVGMALYGVEHVDAQRRRLRRRLRALRAARAAALARPRAAAAPPALRRAAARRRRRAPSRSWPR